MRQDSTRAERLVGLTVSLALVAGFSFLLRYSLQEHVPEDTPGDRYLTAAFSVMMISMGLSGLARLATRDSPGFIRLSAGLFTFAFAVFGGLFVAVGVFRGDQLSGGLPFLPRAVNSAIGSCLFAGAGLVVLLMLGMIYRAKRDQG